MRSVPAVIAMLCWLALACGSPSPKGTPLVVTDLKLGTLKRSGADIVLDQERSRLPRVAGSSGDLAHTFGICFTATGGGRPHTLDIWVFPPEKISQTSLRREGEGVRVTVELSQATERLCQEMFFDASDPVGPWRFELRDGAQTLRTWDIEVYAP